MSDGVLIPWPTADAAARAEALDIRRSFIVEAPAGSGKTGLLLQRFLKLLADPYVDEPEQIVAATFTRKATHELRERIVRQLKAAGERASGHSMPQARSAFDAETASLADAAYAHNLARNWRLVEQPWRLAVRTLDALAGDVLRRSPALGSAALNSSPATDAEPLYMEAAERTFALLGSNDAALQRDLETLLLHRDGDLARCTSMLANMLSEREQWATLLPVAGGTRMTEQADEEVRRRLERALDNIICSGLARVRRLASERWLHRAALLSAELSSLLPGKPGALHPFASCAQLSGPPEAIAPELDRWLALIHLVLKADGGWRAPGGVNKVVLGEGHTRLQKDIALELLDEVQGNDDLHAALCAVRRLPPPRYPEDQWRVARALFHVLVRAAAELRVLFAERATTDFTEITLAAAQSLAETAGAREFSLVAGAPLRHLLVDEMQDTSASQYALLEGLTRSWDGGSQTLFLVGDPKQSIYAFRQARVERFIRTQRERELRSLPLTPLTLTANFRSAPALVSSFNDVFCKVFPAAGTPVSDLQLDPPYSAVSSQRANGAALNGAGMQWHELPVAAPSTVVAAAGSQASEARAIADTVAAWRQRTAGQDRRSSIAVLVRSRRHALPILQALRAQGIPYRALDMEPLGSRPEVLDLLSLCRALLHGGDRLAWLATLRAPWCGLSLADLLHITGDDDPAGRRQAIPYVVEQRLSHLSPNGQALMARCWPVLRAAVERSGREPLAGLLHRTWRSLGGDATMSAEQRDNTRAFLALLGELEQPGPRLDLRQLRRRMEKLYAAPSSDPDAIDVCTMHKAKGLEWDLVLCPTLAARSQPPSKRLLDWLERDAASDAEAAVVLAPVGSSYAAKNSDRLSSWVHAERTAFACAENRRLFYVACTRAREELHLYAAVKRSAEGVACKPDAASLLAAAWPYAKTVFAEPQHAAESANIGVAAPASFAAANVLPFSPPTQAPVSHEPSLALAAGADEDTEMTDTGEAEGMNFAPIVQRLPLSFVPYERLRPLSTLEQALGYSAAATPTPLFVRPEGSHRARALGNVIHRFLEVFSTALATTTQLPDEALSSLEQQLPTYAQRLQVALRSEGLSTADTRRMAAIASRAFAATLADVAGRWLLQPHAAAQNELSLRSAADAVSGLRIDRTFVAGAEPLSRGEASHRWIVDWKTSAQSGSLPADFESRERQTYGPQLERYAAALRPLAPALPVRLALYYPLIGRLIWWPADMP